MPREILIMLPTKSLDDSWSAWLARMREAEGFVGAREIEGVWHVLIAPASPAAEVARTFFDERNGIKRSERKGWKGARA